MVGKEPGLAGAPGALAGLATEWETWGRWLPKEYDQVWILADVAERLKNLAQDQGLLRGHSAWVVREANALGDTADPQIGMVVGGPWAVVSRTRAHDLVLWGPGTPDEEAEWAPLMEVLEAKGLFVLHWVQPDDKTLARYQHYLHRHVDQVRETFVLDWDPDIFGG